MISVKVKAKSLEHKLGSFNDARQTTGLESSHYTDRVGEMQFTHYPTRMAYFLHLNEILSFLDMSSQTSCLLPGRTIVLGFLEHVVDRGIALQEVRLKEVSFDHPLGIKCTVPDLEFECTGMGKVYLSDSFFVTFANKRN